MPQKKYFRVKLFFATFLLLTAGFTGLKSLKNYLEWREIYLQGGNIIYDSGDVLGITSDELAFTTDYGKQKSTSLPILFGGVHTPKPDHTRAWELLQYVGVTSMRTDYFLNSYFPSKLTLEDYKNNVNGIQDPAKWNQIEVTRIKNRFKEAKKRNMKTIGIQSYAVNWLTHNGSNFGVPKDWDVYEELVRKSYGLFRDDLDYVEIWNEPDLEHFLNLENSGLSREEAYYQIVKHAIKAIREVDAAKNDGKKAQVGVGVLALPNITTLLDKVFADSELKQQINFVSYHNYEHLQEPSDTYVKTLLKKYNAENTPLMLTEWAHSPNLKAPDPYVLSDLGISYSGAKFTDFMNMGVMGANYFALQQIDPASPRGDEGYLGFYELKDGQTTLLPLSKTWTLMSKTLGLGTGSSNVYETTKDSNVKAASWKNPQGQYGMVVSNTSDATKTYNVTIYNLPMSGWIEANAYIASPTHDAKTRSGAKQIKMNGTTATMKIVAPPNSVVGIKFAQIRFSVF